MLVIQKLQSQLLDGGGSNATATAVIDTSDSVSQILVTNSGTGYTSTPTVTISAPDLESLPASEIAANSNFGYAITIDDPLARSVKDKDMKDNAQLDDILDVKSTTIIEIDDDNKPLPTTYRPSLHETDKEVENDTKYVRQNFYDLIEKGHSAIDELLAVARSITTPERAYEVLATMIKTMGDNEQ